MCSLSVAGDFPEHPSSSPTISRSAPRGKEAANQLGGYADEMAAEDRETDVVILLKASRRFSMHDQAR